MDDSSCVNQKQNLNFQKLTPSHIDDLGVYEKALDFAFSEEDILNIALTGPYASGKTSIINSYIKEKKFSTMNISLAYFEPIEGEKVNKPYDEVKQKLKEERNQSARELMLERKIINQLIHQVESDKIPDTEFRVKHKPNKLQVGLWTFFITFLIMFFSYFSKDWFLTIIERNDWLPISLFIVVIATIAFLIYQVVEVQSRKNIIQKLKIFDAELDISGSKKDESYFDKYLDEIIYILEKSKVKAIVFEDIDRYDDNLILSKLRELNCIYNRKHFDKDMQIKFIYLIKDEMFESKDRTKFFDFILPIIPIVDASNSLSKLNEFFEKGGVKSDFKDRTFLHDLSLYIDDIRLIKNIYNEYMIYRNKLHLVGDKKHDWLVPERLLAIITYKNLFPKDFSATRLGHGRGVLHRIINSFAQFEKAQKREKILEIDQEIAQLQQEIKDAEAEQVNSLLELQYLYIKLPCRELWLPDNENTYRIARSSLSNTEFLERVINNSNYVYLNQSTHYNQFEDLTELFQNVEQNAEFIKRKSLLKGGKKHIINEKNNKIKEKKQEKVSLQLKQKIVDIIKESNQSIDTLFEKHLDLYKGAHHPAKEEYEVLKHSAYFPVIGYFLRNGIIDENYSDYMSFFYERGIPVNDTSFLRNLAGGVDSDWALELRTVDILLKSHLKNEHFHSVHILNFSLLDYLLIEKNNFFNIFVTTLEQNKCIDFIDQYILREQDVLKNCDSESGGKQQQQKIVRFINAINKQWPIYWDLTAIDKQFYLYLSFKKVTTLLLNNMNLENKLVNYINNTGDFFRLDKANDWVLDLPFIARILAELDIKMKQITDANTELLTLLCDDEHYEINLTNIDYLLVNQYGVVADKTHYLQTIESLSESALSKYVRTDTNINLLIQELLNSETKHFNDNEETVIKLLNDTALKIEYKQAYIAKLATVVDDLSSVTDKEVWNSLLANQKLTYSAKNIIYYFFNYIDNDGEAVEVDNSEFTPELVEFINSQNTSFKDESVNGLLENKQQFTIFRKIIQCKTINNERYSALLSWLNIHFVNFDLIGIDDNKMSILIQQGVVRLEKQHQKIQEKLVIQSLKFLRDHYPQHMTAFVVKNIIQYVERLKAKPDEFDYDELLGLLNTKITDKQKLALLPLAKDSIPLQNIEVSDDIKAYILEHNFDTNDLSYIGSTLCYDQSNDTNKKIISQLILGNIGHLGQLDNFSYELLQVLLAEDSLEIEDKYKLITKILNQLEPNQACNSFEIIERSEEGSSLYKYQFSSLFKRRRPTIPKNNITEPIVDIFISKDWASKSDGEELADSFKLNGRSLV